MDRLSERVVSTRGQRSVATRFRPCELVPVGFQKNAVKTESLIATLFHTFSCSSW